MGGGGGGGEKKKTKEKKKKKRKKTKEGKNRRKEKKERRTATVKEDEMGEEHGLSVIESGHHWTMIIEFGCQPLGSKDQILFMPI